MPDSTASEAIMDLPVEAVATYGTLCPDVSPPEWHDLAMGVIRQGIFYPWGSVARHFFCMQHQFNREEKRLQDVYVIQCQETGVVKVGTSRDPAARLRALQTGHPFPLRLLHIFPHGGKTMEKAFHRRLAAWKLLGEWFAWNPVLEELIRDATAERA